MRRRADIAICAAACALVIGVSVFAPGAFSAPAPASRPETARTEIDRTLTAEARTLRVIDGDTLEDRASGITYRLVNIDTPETGDRAGCASERTLGDRATRAARRLLTAAHSVELHPTGRIDHYGRTIAYVSIDGRDLGETLIASRLARPWRGRREPWCDRDGNLIS